MIYGTDCRVLEEHEIDGYRLQRLRWSPGYEQWRCDCPEFLTIKPLSMKAWCQHCEWAGSPDLSRWQQTGLCFRAAGGDSGAKGSPHARCHRPFGCQ